MLLFDVVYFSIAILAEDVVDRNTVLTIMNYDYILDTRMDTRMPYDI
jgi:hypothetical protein